MKVVESDLVAVVAKFASGTIDCSLEAVVMNDGVSLGDAGQESCDQSGWWGVHDVSGHDNHCGGGLVGGHPFHRTGHEGFYVVSWFHFQCRSRCHLFRVGWKRFFEGGPLCFNHSGCWGCCGQNLWLGGCERFLGTGIFYIEDRWLHMKLYHGLYLLIRGISRNRSDVCVVEADFSFEMDRSRLIKLDFSVYNCLCWYPVRWNWN